MAGFISRLVACLVAVVAVLQLVHLVLLNKLESTRLHELRRLQQQQQYHNLHHPQQEGDEHLFQEPGSLLRDNTNQNPQQHSITFVDRSGGNNNNAFHPQDPQQQWGNWRPERSAVGGAGAAFPDVSEQEIRFDHLLREDQGAIMDSTGEFRIVFDVAAPRSSFQLGNFPPAPPAAMDKDAINPGTNAQTDDFSIDDENFEGPAPPIDVTLVTFGDFLDSIQHLIPLVSRWNSPISVAIFASNSGEMQQALEFISQARQCHGPTREYVSFHLVFPLVETHSRGTANNHNNNNSSNNGSSRFERWKSDSHHHQQQKRLNQSSSSSNNSKMPIELTGKSCQSFRDQINKYYHSGESKSEHGRKQHSSDKQGFPVNLLRNVARRRVVTEYSFVINMDMVPSRDLRTSFQQFARDRLVGSGDAKKTVFVVPAFEIKSEEQIPLHKVELLALIDKHRARPFQFDLCWKCQMYTDYETWQRERGKSNKLGILFEVLWKDPWEPFFISDNSVPLFDERFRRNGVSRTSQLCELHVAGYKFAVLNDAFLVHRGYAVVPKNQQEERNRDVDTIRAHFRQFKIELKDKYPHSTRRCY